MKLRSSSICLGAVLLSAVLCAPASAANVGATPLPVPGGASDLIVGPDGALWFANVTRDEIDRYDIATGAFGRFPIVHREDEGETDGPSALTAGADGKVWYLTDDGREIGRISSAGIPETVDYNESEVFGKDISAAPGGGIWESIGGFSNTSGELRFLSESGTFAETTYEGDYSSGGPVSTAADGTAWIGDWGARISSVTTADAIGSYPTAIGSTEEINSIAFGPDGSVWYAGFAPAVFAGGESGVAFSSAYGGSIGHLAPGGTPQGFKIGDNALTGSITAGADGAMWFAVAGGVGRIEPSGAYKIGPTPGYQPGTRSDPSNLVYGPDGSLWFIDDETSTLVKVAIDGALFPAPPAPPSPPPPPPPAPAPKLGPKMGLLVKSQRVRQVERHKGIVLTCSLDGTGSCSLQLTVKSSAARALHLKVPKKAKAVTLAKTSRSFKKSGALTLVVKLPGKVLRALRHLRKPLDVTVVATTTSSGHTPRSITKKIQIEP